jgi:uracil-DNA glycosylase family protein
MEGYPPPPIPARGDLAALSRAAAGCQACDLHEKGTQTVFGEGRSGARLMLVGEQPGDREDREGRPFVGSAGRLLDRALDAAGIERRDVYITNVVKHFNWVPAPRGERRIHKTPNGLEIAACRPWLSAEIEAVDPELIVALGATAAQALFGRQFRVTRSHGELNRLAGGRLGSATIHPSAALRAPEAEQREQAFAGMVEDLRRAASGLATARRQA